MADKDKIEKIISMGTEVDTSNGEKQLNDFINKNRIIKFDIEPTKSAISNALKKIQSEFNEKKTPVYFNVAVRKSSISKALSDLREEVSKTKPITVSVVPKMDVNSSQFAGKNNIARIKNYIQSLLKDVEVKLTPKFDMKSITASIRNMKQELNKVAGEETEVKTNIIVNRSGNVGSPEALDSWLKSLRKFANFATKVPNGEINLRVNLGANIDAGFKQLIEGGFDLSKIKSGKLDINVNGNDSSTGGSSRRKGGSGKGTISDDTPDTIPEPQIIPAMTRSKIIEVINKRFNTDAKNLVEAIEKSSGINLSSAGRNIGVHIQSAMSKLAKEAEDRVIQGDKEGAQAIKNLVGKLRNMYAGQDPYLRETGKFTNLTDGQVINRYTKLATQDSNVSLDSGRYAQIDASNKERRTYLDNLKREQELFVKIAKDKDALWKHGAEQLAREIEALWETNKRLFKNNKSNPQVENKLAEVHNLQNRLVSGDADVASAVQKYFANKAKEIANLLEYAKSENSEILEAFRISGMQGVNTTKVFNNLNPLNHGEKLENLASQRANLSGYYWAGAEHKRKANDLRKERLDPLQKEIDDLIVARNKGEKSQLGTNPELLNLINTKLRLMSEIGGADFGLKQQIDYIKSLKNKNIDADAHGMIEKLLNQMNKELAESFRGTIEDRIKYYKNQISEAFKQIKDKAGRGEDVTSDVNRYMGFRSKLLEAQSQQSGGASADYSGASKGMLALSNIKGIDSKLLADIKQAEAEFRELAKAQSAAGDTAKKLSNEYEALKTKLNSVTSNGDISKIASKMESNLMARFGRGDNVTRDIQALSQMATALNSKGLDGEPIARLARRMKELSDEAKKVTQAEQQATKAQTTQNQAIVDAEKELERLARELDKAYRAETAISKLNPFSKQSIEARKATQDYKNQLEVLYKLKRELGQLRSDGDVAKELLGKSGISNNKNFLGRTNNFVRNTMESLAGKYAREEGYARDRARRSSFSNSLVDYLTYSGKFLGRSAKGSGSALEASAMGLKDAFNLLKGSTSVIGRGFGAAGVAISAFVGGVALGVEAMSWIVNIFQRLYDVVSRLLQPGIELYKQVTKATYSMGAAISSNAMFAGAEIDLAHGIATSANLQQRAMLDAEKSVFDFGEIMTSLSGTLPILLGRGMTLDQAYRTNLGVASVAKLTNLAPNQVLQETRDLAQGTITARSSQVANALGISSADLQGRDADEIFNFFMDKFKNYEDVLKQYAETPVGAFEQMMDRLKLVSMKFVEEIAFPFKELFNWITDMTGTWVDSTKRKLMRVDMGDGTTEQFWRYINEDGSEAKGQGAKYTINEAMTKLGDKLFLLKEAIDNSVAGKASAKDTDVLSKFGLNASDLAGKDITYRDVFKDLFGEVFEPIGETEFQFSDIMENLKKQFVDVFTYLGDALDELIAYISDAFGVDLSDTITDVSGVIKLLIDAFVLCAEIVVDVVSEIYNYCKANQLILENLYAIAKVAYNAFSLFGRLFRFVINGWQMVGNGVLVVINTLLEKLTSVVGENPLSRWFAGAKASAMGRIDKGFESFEYVKAGVSEDYNDILSALGLTDKKSKDAFSFIADMIENGKANFEEYKKKMKRESGKAIDPKDALGKKKPESDKDKEKREREARKAEKKAFDKYIAQLRDALEKHIQDLKDALDKNEAAYKQGLKNYDAYIQDKLKFEIEEQVAKREELQAEIEAIRTTGKYESEDEREKDLYEADKKLQSINTAISKLTTTQNEVAGILNDGNQLLEQLVGLNHASNDKKNKEDNSNLTTKVETKETSLDVSGLIGLGNIDSLDDKKSWAMQYFRESGYASDNASSILAHALTNSADLSGNIFNFDADTLNAYATQAGLNLANASDMFKASIAIATDRIKEAIPTDNSYTLDQFNAELKKLGMFIGDADLSVMNDLVHSFKPFMKQITTTTHTLGNANSVVNQAINGYKEGEEWLNPMRSDIHGGIQCDSWVGDVYYEGGLRNIGNSSISKGTVIQDWMFQQAGLWHDVNSGYVPKPGDYISGRTHVGIVLPDGKVRSRDSWSSGVTTYDDIADWDRYHHIEGYGEIGPLLGNVTNAITDVSEKITRGTTSTYTGEGLQAIEMKEKYLTTEFDLQAQLDKYEQTAFDTIKALSESAEVVKKSIEAKYKILKTTGINDEQQKRLISKEERLMLYQIQETMAKLIEEQANSYIEDIEAQFNFDIASSGSRVDFNSIADKYDSVFVDMNTDVGRTINNIKQAIKDADETGDKAVAKSLRQTLNKFTTKLSELFDKAEEAINKQFEYVETAINNIGATNLQKEGMSRRFNVEKNHALAEMYAKQENIYGNIYKNQNNDALEELHRNGELSAETLQKLADTEMKLTQIHWAKQQAEELGEFKTQLEEANDVFKQALEDGLVDYMTDGVNAVLDGTKTIGDAFKDLAVSILKTMQQFFAKRLIEGLMNKLYPTTDKEKQIVDTANWKPESIFEPSQQQKQMYGWQKNNPQLQPYMKDGFIIKNAPYGPLNKDFKPEYEAINPAIQLRTELNDLGGAAKSAADALWQIRDYYSGEVKYPDNTQAQMSADSLAQSMDRASLSTDMNTSSTEANTMAESNSTTTEMQSNLVEQQGIALDEQSNLQTQQHTTDVINDTNATRQHSDAVRNDSYGTMSGGQGEASGFGTSVGTGVKSGGSFSGNFITNLMGSDFMQLVGGLFATYTLFKGDTKEKLLSMIFLELQLMYIELIKMSSLLMGLGFASGGYVRGPGTNTSDSIPAMLSDGEFVVKASAVRKYGTNFLDAVNNGTFATIKPRHHYASGGLVTETAREATSTVVTELGRGIGTNINNEAHFNLVMASNQEDAMKAFMRSPEGQRIYLDMARKYASTTVRF